jgi:hypothetical protein
MHIDQVREKTKLEKESEEIRRRGVASSSTAPVTCIPLPGLHSSTVITIDDDDTPPAPDKKPFARQHFSDGSVRMRHTRNNLQSNPMNPMATYEKLWPISSQNVDLKPPPVSVGLKLPPAQIAKASESPMNLMMKGRVEKRLIKITRKSVIDEDVETAYDLMQNLNTGEGQNEEYFSAMRASRALEREEHGYVSDSMVDSQDVTLDLMKLEKRKRKNRLSKFSE